MSTQLAQNKKTSFMLLVNEILRLYGSINPVKEQNINTPVNYSANLPKIINNYSPKWTQDIPDVDVNKIYKTWA